MAPFGLARARMEHKGGKCHCRAYPRIGVTRAPHSIHLPNDAAVEPMRDASRECTAAIPYARPSPEGDQQIAKRCSSLMNCMWDFDEAMRLAAPTQSAAGDKKIASQTAVGRRQLTMSGVCGMNLTIASNSLSSSPVLEPPATRHRCWAALVLTAGP
jgi:hypothetical protein